MKKLMVWTLLPIILLPGFGCVGSRRVDATSELGTLSHATRIQPGEGPGWRLTMPVVHRNREPKAANWPAALESLFRAAPEALAAVAVSGNFIAGIGLAETLGTWLVPDLSSTQNVVFEFDGLATKVTVKGLRQEETADGRVSSTVDAVEVEAADKIEVLKSPADSAAAP